MWLLIIIIIIAGFILLSQFISRLDGENFPALGKIITTERVADKKASAKDAFETMSGQNAPYFNTLLFLNVDSPGKLTASWKIAPAEYETALHTHHATAIEPGKAILKLNYQGRVYFKEDYPIYLNQAKTQLLLNAPGCEIFAELGFYTVSGDFFALARSNTITMPT